MNINSLIIIILFFVLFIFYGLIAVGIFQLIKLIKRKTIFKFNFFFSSNIKKILWVIVILISIYESYTAVYPNNSFYYDEFEYVTTLKIPESAKILKDFFKQRRIENKQI